MRKVTKPSAIGEKGIALISLRVSEMGHLWHPTSGVDSGIDGEIELRDPGSGEVRDFRIGVQSKATEGVWCSETDDSSLFLAGASEDLLVRRRREPIVTDMYSVVAGRSEPLRHNRRQRVVDEELQPAGTSGSSRSRIAAAAYSSASRMSSGSRSG